MRETAVLFGRGQSQVGVVTDPEPRLALRSRPAVILLNAGLLHRVGPGRLYVRIARRLADAGFVCLRMDFSGIGDSEVRRTSLSYEDSTVGEAREAMDFLTAARSVSRFIFMGVCAGAENTLRIAGADARVAGAVMVDGFAYRTPGFYLRHYGSRLLSVWRWRNLLAGRSDSGRRLRRLLRLGRGADQDPSGGVPYSPVIPPKKAMLADLSKLVDRGTELFLVYSAGGMENYYNHSAQFGEAFPSLRGNARVRAEFFAEADHLFTILSHQEALVAAIEGWARSRWGDGDGTAA